MRKLQQLLLFLPLNLREFPIPIFTLCRCLRFFERREWFFTLFVVWVIVSPKAVWCLNPMYHYTIIAEEGMITSGGEQLSGIEPNVSVNEEGRVAFIADTGAGDQLMVGWQPLDAVNVSRSPAGRNFDFPQINNHNKIVTRELYAGQSLVRLWLLNNIGAFFNIAKTGLSPFSQLTIPTLGNTAGAADVPLVGFLGRIGTLPFSYWATDSVVTNNQDLVSNLTGTTLARFRATSADAEKTTIVAQYRSTTVNNDNGRIVVFSYNNAWVNPSQKWNAVLIATTVNNDWYELSNAPGISGSGQFVAFIGDHNEDGPGFYLAAANPTFTAGFVTARIFDLDDAIAYDDQGDPIFFEYFDFLNPVGIVHEERSPLGLNGDSIVLTFMAKPERASRKNPTSYQSEPFFFSEELGVWTLRVDIERELDGTRLRYHMAGPIPVAQEGDWIGGGSIHTLTLHDPLALARTDEKRRPLPVQPGTMDPFGPGNHYVAFAALVSDGLSNNTVRVVRAGLIDTDGDALFDHWETEGIDLDNEDGEVELDLPAMGADPYHKDVFLEVDWSTDRTQGGHKEWTNRFAPYTPQRLAQMYQNAPVDNPSGRRGITLHVDAGPDGMYAENPSRRHPQYGLVSFIPNSVNMGTDPLLMHGGDQVGLADDPEVHLDVVYFGIPFDFSVPGINMRSLHDIKNHHFGDEDRWAREFAFKYAFLTDHQLFVNNDPNDRLSIVLDTVKEASDFTITGNTPFPNDLGRYDSVLITQGKGEGQLRVIDAIDGSTAVVRHAWEDVPDASSAYTLIDSPVGCAEVFFYNSPDHHARPANDLILSMAAYDVNDDGWLANFWLFWHTLAHELGHTFGLRHGGINHINNKINYRSLMNYRYDTVLNDYSTFGDPVFDDWSYLKYDFQHTGYHFGNAFHPYFFETPNPPDPVDFDTPPDLTKPLAVVVSPEKGTRVPFGDDLTVVINATDNVEVDSVFAVFDVDGDGFIEDSAERKEAAPVGGGNYSAVFENVRGPFNARGLMGIAFDTSGNIGADVIPLVAGDAAGSVDILSESEGTFAAQASAASGGERQKDVTGPIDIPGTGRLSFTVQSAPPARSSSPGENRFESAVSRITFNGREVDLQTVCNLPGSNPAICTSYWQSPSSGSMAVEVVGPAIMNDEGDFLGSPLQQYDLTVSFKAVDVTPPGIDILNPSLDDVVETTEDLNVIASVTDDYGVQAVEVAFDINGDGKEDGEGEIVAASDIGNGDYSAGFLLLSGPAGPRTIRVKATDTAGLEQNKTAVIDVKEPDTTFPTAVIQSPAAGWPIEQGDTLVVEVLASDDIGIDSVDVAFDLDGDGTASTTGETVVADHTGINLYTAEFMNLTGPNGSRTIRVSATDTAMNSTTTSVPVTVGGVEEVVENLVSDSGHFDAQSSGGSQQTYNFPSIQIPKTGTVTFTVTGDPSVRALGTNISRSDPYVKNIIINGQSITLYNLKCNAWDEPISVCTTSFEVEETGDLDFSVLGPGSWNTWGEFVGHPEQDFTIEIELSFKDIQRPSVTILSPGLGADMDLGTPFTVDLTVTDAEEVASVVASFDLNGDGEMDDAGENLAASEIGPDTYQAAFGSISGGPGTRSIEILATDTSFNTTRKTISVGVGGVGEGETVSLESLGTIPEQRDQFNGGQRQVISVDPIAVTGIGRLTFRVTTTPTARSLGTNLERHDPKVVSVHFNGETISLTPQCNDWDSDPAVCESVWDSPGAGSLSFEVLGAASYNIWGEFIGSPEQDYSVEVLFLPGPIVNDVAPEAGSVYGHETVTIHGHGFAYDTVVLFNEVPAADVVRVSDQEISCSTPPGISGKATVTVINPDMDEQPWNYGVPYGLFGRLEEGFTYQTSGQAVSKQGERPIGVYKGFFPECAKEDPQQQANQAINLPGAGRIRFEAWAFLPILNPIQGPFENPEDLSYHNESTAVRKFIGGGGDVHYPSVASTDLSFPYGPVISNATSFVENHAAGAGEITIKGPARWNAFWRQFGDYVMESAPSQHWSLIVWFSDQPVLTSISRDSGTISGGTRVTLVGDHFSEGVIVKFGDTLATDVTVINETTLTCRTPQHAQGDVSVSIEHLGMVAILPTEYSYVKEENKSMPWVPLLLLDK